MKQKQNTNLFTEVSDEQVKLGYCYSNVVSLPGVGDTAVQLHTESTTALLMQHYISHVY